ncbi:hypothetical protein [Lysinibacillus odysseyi]|uniref:Uncharacterized protein n=1 Tax=Lysinibacillus odysseyi 34hs-1 = NBRC 100172 TaxID=1220589 RepID=A0A0A3IY86_9BACI|nr:hypothetical protein [Lysinibacillus odysseyi]KGR88410.1 hypothetical protein CD32_01750 [Lysinibacillus odysseyi 34hs-1 = NBRC 100172]
MNLTDGAWVFDPKKIDEAIGNDYRGWYERDMLNAFTRHAYYLYQQIRDRVNTRRCKHMTVEKVLKGLQDENVLKNVCQSLKISEEEVFYIVDFAGKHLKYVK